MTFLLRFRHVCVTSNSHARMDFKSGALPVSVATVVSSHTPREPGHYDGLTLTRMEFVVLAGACSGEVLPR